ncbi:hypothetical protein [Nocardia fluminea]|uniref:hypothetical protein n=1 Tax=Nocardia fluminea TaxID=134984 RepID=UPI0033C93F77
MHERELAGLRRAISDIDKRAKNNIRSLELVDDVDQELIRDLNARRAELRAEKQQLLERGAEVEARVAQIPNVELIDALPLGSIDVGALPEGMARRLFEALRLEIHYDVDARNTMFKITLTANGVSAARYAAQDAVVLPFPGKSSRDQGDPKTGSPAAAEDENPNNVPMFLVPSAGRIEDGNARDLDVCSGQLVI